MDKKSPIKERMLYFIEYKGISKTDFCNNLGFSYANFKGKSLESEIGGEQIGKVLSYYTEISAEWLMRGEGKMLKDKSVKSYKVDKVDLESENDLKDKIINLLEINSALKDRIIELEKQIADITNAQETDNVICADVS